jgi:two-component system, sensor histidine kinase
MNNESLRVARHDGAPPALPGADRDQHIAMVAHELRSPLLPIINAAAVISKMPEDAELVRRSAAIIERQSRIISRMIDDLMSLSSAQLGTLRLRRAQVPMATIVRRSLETVEPYAVQRGIRLIVNVSSAPMELYADALRLSQALQNVLFNAAKFSDPDSEIQLRVERIQDEISIAVSDQGIGIAAADLESMFEVFKPGDSRHSEGLGIGLYLARHLIEAHGGSLVAASAGPKRGSTFTIHIPCLALDADTAKVPQDLRSSRSDSLSTTP